MQVWIVTRYVQVGYDTCRDIVGPFSTEAGAVGYCIKNDPNYAAPTVEKPKTLDVLGPYEVDALISSEQQPIGDNR